MLGWVNVQTELKIIANRAPLLPCGTFDRNLWLMQLTQKIRANLKRRKIEIAHFKTSLAGRVRDLSAVQMTHSAHEPEVSRFSDVAFGGGQLLINLRAEGDPDVLLAAVLKAMSECLDRAPELKLGHLHSEHFRPGQPVPTHRVAKF